MPKLIITRGKITVFLIISIFFGFIFGFILGRSISGEDQLILCGDYADGWEAARKKISGSGGLLPNAAMPSESLGGTIRGVGSDRVIFASPLLNPLDDESLKERTALITDETEIILRKIKTAADLAAEKETRDQELKKLKDELSDTENGEELIRTDGRIKKLRGEINDLQDKKRTLTRDAEVSALWIRIEALEMREPDTSTYKEVNGNIGDVKTGSIIFVMADKDISQSREFTAVKVIVSEKPPVDADMLPDMPELTAESSGGLGSSRYGN